MANRVCTRHSSSQIESCVNDGRSVIINVIITIYGVCVCVTDYNKYNRSAGLAAITFWHQKTIAETASCSQMQSNYERSRCCARAARVRDDCVEM